MREMQLDSSTLDGVLQIALACIGHWLIEHEYYLNYTGFDRQYLEVECAGEIIRSLRAAQNAKFGAVETLSDWGKWYKG